jgi:outer membrane beta-barrel protein
MLSEIAFAQSSQYKRTKSRTSKKEKAKKKKSPEKGDKVDITDLEKKYWSAKDTDFSVVQNRAYTKVKRVAVTASVGAVTNDSFNDGLVQSVNIDYYWSERMGAGIEYMNSSLDDSKLVERFESQFGQRPDMNTLNSFIGVHYNWVPIYAKVSLLGKKILYFDFAVSPGIGMSSYEQTAFSGNKDASTVALTLDLTQYFFLSKWLALRIDFKNRWQQEEVLEYKSSSGNTGGHLRDETTQSSFLMFGATYFF